jgi:hypothetical protein
MQQRGLAAAGGPTSASTCRPGKAQVDAVEHVGQRVAVAHIFKCGHVAEFIRGFILNRQRSTSRLIGSSNQVFHRQQKPTTALIQASVVRCRDASG